MNRVHGITFTIGSFENGIWYDSDRSMYHPKGCGIRFHVVCGKLLQPIPRFYKLDYWRWLLRKPHLCNHNYWKGGEYWFVIRIPIIVLPFISIAIGKLGLYFGGKTYGVTTRLYTNARYKRWIKREECGPTNNEYRYVLISSSWRKTRWE